LLIGQLFKTQVLAYPSNSASCHSLHFVLRSRAICDEVVLPNNSKTFSPN
jgi:hypothetical protein